MKILALESTALTASAALCEEETVLGEITLNHGNTHSETLLPMVEFLLGQFRMKVPEIGLFAVTTGPGSFTGIRIGVSTIKGLAFGTGIPCVGVSAPEALADRLALSPGLICPVMNARRNQVYTALFRSDGNVPQRLLPDSVMSVEALNLVLSEYREPVHLCGDGYALATQALSVPLVPAPESVRVPSAVSVARVARRMRDAGACISDRELSPIYLRAPQAERERAERLSHTKISFTERNPI